MAVQTPSVAGIILAAGRSRRMGKNKLLLDWQGKPLLQHVIDSAVASPLIPLFLVLDRSDISLAGRMDTGACQLVRCRSNVYSDSLRAGLAALDKQCKGAMFLLGDQPLVTSATITKLVNVFQAAPNRWVAPVFGGRRGNPVIAPSAWFDRIAALEGDTGPRGFLQDPAARLHLVPVEDEGVVFDIDRPGDYQLLLRR